MARLELDRAPPSALPLRFLLSTPVWGLVAGGLLLADGEAALLTRWAPSTLALAHVITLGVLGNAMFGSLLQFLPAAAGVRVRGAAVGGYLMHGLLNAGSVALVTGLRFGWPHCLAVAAACLGSAFVLLASTVLPGLLGSGLRLLHLGLANAVVAGLATAALGIALVGGLTGVRVGLPVLPWVDAHAALGLVGWVTILLGSVAQVVMPMFQGTPMPSPRVEASWLAFVAAGLAIGVPLLAAGQPHVLHTSAGVGVAWCAAAALWRQWRAVRSRNAWLVRMWRAGLVALLAAAAGLVVDAPAMWVGALALGAGMPWLVIGMQVEIVPFLGWIDLHRRAGRGVRLPSVQTLLPEREKGLVVVLQLTGGLALIGAAVWPSSLSARVAGGTLLLAHGVLAAVLWRSIRRGVRFLATRQAIA